MQTIQDLAQDIKSLLSRSSDPDEIGAAVEALARPFVVDQSWVTDESYAVDEDQGIGIHLLHEEPDYRLLIQTVCWLPGRGVKPHDHQTWGVVLGLDGEETNTSWHRIDDGSKPGHAELEVSDSRIMKRGDVVQLRKNDIHSVTNDGEKRSLSLHIYGADIARTNRSEFDPDDKTQRPCPQRDRTKSN